MKKILIALLVTIFTMVSCATDEDNVSSVESVMPIEKSSAPEIVAEPDYFTVASDETLTADFMECFAQDELNLEVINLIHGYKLYEFTENQQYELNEIVVKEVATSLDTDGNKTYTFTLNEDLKWNNGNLISAEDYVFAIMLKSSEEFASLGAKNSDGFEFLGYTEFHSGTTNTFSGIRLLGEYKFSITIKAEALPNYFETALFEISPYPIEIIAPNATITDEWNGATISGEFSQEVLEKTIMDTETGYRYNPQISSGAYTLIDFIDGEAILEANEEYLGWGDNEKIEIMKVKSLEQAKMLDELKTEEVDLYLNVSDPDIINEVLTLETYGFSSYDRAGYGQISFACEFGPTQFSAVRQAIAYCIDRQDFVNEYTGGFGRLPYSYYAFSQWEYEDNNTALAMNLNTYSFNLEKAEQELINNGWIFNENGYDFVKGVDEIRYKKVDDELMPLIINWASTIDNPVSSLINETLPQNALEIGMKIVQEEMDFEDLVAYYFRPSESLAVYHMFNLATDFAKTMPVWYYFSTDIAYQGVYNIDRINDEELYSIALEMQNIETGDTEAWSAKWLEFQLRYNELLVNLPLYSDKYYDLYSTNLTDYNPDGLWSWEKAIISSSLAK